MTTLVPLSCAYLAAATPGRIHAKAHGSDVAVCGATGLALVAYGGEAYSVAEGVVAASLVLPWPPYRQGLGDRPRCLACWEATGKPRPHQAWRGVEPES